jgi:long-subunit fatty acid transport protein
MEKQWQDTVSVRLGGEYRVLPEVLDVRAGTFVENGAAPDAYSHIDFPSFDRLGLGLGLTWHALKTLSLSAGYMHIFQETREVSEAKGKQFQQRPAHPCPQECTDPETGAPVPGVVANAGTFETGFDLLSFGVDFRL